MRELLRVALPLIASSGSQSIMVMSDRMFLTWYSEESLAAVLPAGMLNWTLISIAFGTCQYANTFVAQYEGAKQPERVAASIWQAVWLALAMGILFSLMSLAARPLFDWIGHDAAVIPLEAEYFGILSLGAVPAILSAALSCFFSGRRRTNVVLWVNLTAAATNIIFDYLLIFGAGPIPELGIRGAAVATVLGNVAAVVLYAALMLKKPMRDQYGTWRNRRLDRELFGRFLRYGLPAGLHLFVDIAGFTVFMLLVGRIGRNELAATNLAFNLNALAFCPLLGLGVAVSTLVGNRIGEGCPELAARTTWNAFLLSGSWMLMFAGIYVLLPDLILKPYAIYADEKIASLRDQIVVLLRFVAIYSFFDAMSIVFGSAIRGAGDTRFALVYSLSTGWSLMVLPTFILQIWYGGGLLLSWSFCTLYTIVLGLGFMGRFMAGHWKSMSVLEAASSPETGAQTLPESLSA